MKQITLANERGVALVDDEDYERVAAHGWCLKRGGGRNQMIYASANIKRSGVWKRTLLHRFILNAKSGQKVDHKDNNGLNCQKSNLRFATHSQNQHNSGRRSGKYKGVFWHRGARKWQAQIMAKGVYHYLGLFANEDDAARAYDTAAKKLHKDFAKGNFFDNGQES
jgi:hypothetical protein